MSFDEFSLQLTLKRSGDAYQINVYTTGRDHGEFLILSDGSQMYPANADAAEQLSSGAMLDERAMLGIATRLADEALTVLQKRHALVIERMHESAKQREIEIAAEAAQQKKQDAHLL